MIADVGVLGGRTCCTCRNPTAYVVEQKMLECTPTQAVPLPKEAQADLGQDTREASAPSTPTVIFRDRPAYDDHQFWWHALPRCYLEVLEETGLAMKKVKLLGGMNHG